MSSYAMSKHALSRAVDMALDPEEIRQTIEHPRSQFWSDRTQSWQYTRGRITVCFRQSQEGIWTVTTILWATPAAWVTDTAYDPMEGRGDLDVSGARRTVRAARRSRR